MSVNIWPPTSQNSSCCHSIRGVCCSRECSALPNAAGSVEHLEATYYRNIPRLLTVRKAHFARPGLAYGPWEKTRTSFQFEQVFFLQVFKLRVADDEEAAAFRRRTKETHGATEEELCGDENVRSGFDARETRRQQDPQGERNRETFSFSISPHAAPHQVGFLFPRNTACPACHTYSDGKMNSFRLTERMPRHAAQDSVATCEAGPGMGQGHRWERQTQQRRWCFSMKETGLAEWAGTGKVKMRVFVSNLVQQLWL